MSLSFDEYQDCANRTSRYKDLKGSTDRFLIGGLGLAGEAGEVADLLKKTFGHGHPLDQEKLSKEIGDTLWYIAEVASAAGLSLGVIAEENIIKLTRRYPEGHFSTDRSINRKE